MKKVVNTKKVFIFGISTIIFGILYYLFIYDKYYTVIDGKIYRSAQLSALRLEKAIHTDHIRTIINLRGKSEGTEWYKRENLIAEKNKVALYNLRFRSHALPVYRTLNSLIDVLLTAKRPILIHCWQGTDRAGMTGALALAIDQDAPLSTLKKQFSWKYGVLPIRDSIGIILFKQYEHWLRSNAKEHTREELIMWIRKEYVDAAGNMEYYIDLVNNMEFGPHQEVTIFKDTKKIAVAGWAFDARTYSPVENLSVHIGESLSTRVKYKYNRSDVVKFFDLDERYLDNFNVGWVAEFDTKILPVGCHQISLRHIRDDMGIINVPTEFRICLKE
jgi:protein tyrosine/serine phosphatase